VKHPPVTGKGALPRLRRSDFREAGVAIDASGWQGVAVPAARRPEIPLQAIGCAREAIAQQTCATNSPLQGLDAASSTAAGFRRLSRRGAKWIRVAKSANIKVE